MRTLLNMALACGLLVTSAAQTNAQNTVLNVVQELHFKLTGYYQMSPTENEKTIFRHAGKISINSNDIINLLEQEVDIVFSTDARILIISSTPVDPTPRVVIRDTFQGEKFDTDVTQYFSAEVVASVEESKINKNPLKGSGSSYDVFKFQMDLSEAGFNLQGFAKMKVTTGKYENDPTAIVHTGKIDVTGNGEYRINVLNGIVPVALFGTVQISGTEVKAMTE